MNDVSMFGNSRVRTTASASSGPTAALSIARRNAGLLVALLYLQDVLWLIVSRVHHIYYDPMYQVSSFDWLIFCAFVTFAMFFAALGIFFSKLMWPVRRMSVPNWFSTALVLLAIGFNLLVYVLLPRDARYVSGGMTGSAGVIYGVSQAINLATMIFLIRERKRGRPCSNIWLFSLIGSLSLAIDGLASALTIGVFVFIVSELSVQKLGRVIFIVTFLFGVGWIGFNAKFHEIPNYLSPEFMANWLIARFSIQAEQMYTYLAGNSYIGNNISYIELVFRAISNRIDLVMGQPFFVTYPRSISEAVYFDMMGSFDSGSSPGALLSTAHLGLFFCVFPVILVFLFVQLFYGMSEKASILQLLAYSFLLKSLHADFSEYLTIISPTLLIVSVFFVACLFATGCKRNSSSGGLIIR